VKEISAKVKAASEPKLAGIDSGKNSARTAAKPTTKVPMPPKKSLGTTEPKQTKAAKPRFRLINGKSVPMDEQGNLF
jgi:hypothetical protein